ncbi:NapC/NirT family cytochrome c [Candidatus Oleimmundimicrobium sp.]|uniref:NapC/NirT family cytochrome c n=1 Tax=Candidatus Oleimmundimicrobium sp. TaxID=3060597 RepID=UPI00271D68A9|nr:NapC/NirT family cytochrome c [Candidatus Oleimmundimicrobium sp.]MDO8886202.1 NapC/NirT family cytochrome c [Candidatus Oleimmundimicrobium sp.]
MKETLLELLKKEKIIEILSNPEAYPEKAVLIMGMVIIIVFILLILIGVFTVKPSKKSLEVKAINKEFRKECFLINIEIFAVIILLIMIPLLMYTSTPTFCSSCHVMQNDYESWKVSMHKNIRCITCHYKPGVVNSNIEKINLLRMTFKFFTKTYEEPILAEIRNSSCNKCHNDVKNKSLVNHTIKVNHKEFLEKGAKCADCHNTVAHGKAVLHQKYPHMDYCVTCHNDKEVTSKCMLCHVEDIGKRPREVMDYPKVHLESITSCDGCHDTKTCNKCHGIEMPHPPGFSSPWQHAKLAAFEKQRVCLKCHSLDFCNKCHMFPGHQYEFKPTHGSGGKTGSNCSGCHRTKNFCDLCH